MQISRFIKEMASTIGLFENVAHRWSFRRQRSIWRVPRFAKRTIVGHGDWRMWELSHGYRLHGLSASTLDRAPCSFAFFFFWKSLLSLFSYRHHVLCFRPYGTLWNHTESRQELEIKTRQELWNGGSIIFILFFHKHSFFLCFSFLFLLSHFFLPFRPSVMLVS